MKWITTIVLFIAWTFLYAGNSNNNSAPHRDNFNVPADSAKQPMTLASYVSTDKMLSREQYSLKQINFIIEENKTVQFSLGKSQQGRPVNAFYFPGKSEQRALVIAGVHGSELSSVEVAYQLLKQLIQGNQPYYSVIVVPSLFPDNTLKAINEPDQINSTANIGRYTMSYSVDPNRQMPSPGKAYDESTGIDHLGRKIETENQLLLQLIQSFRPHRIINVHAIRNMNYGGVYADPRTDHNGIASGYSSDSSLAIEIARYIHQRGGNVAGNSLNKKPTPLYYKDPIPAPAGFIQKRNMTGSALNANRGSGISLGTWASTAIAHEKDPAKNREAIRLITMEYPGCKRPADYSIPSEQLFQQSQVELFAAAIRTIFLGNYFTEDNGNN